MIKIFLLYAHEDAPEAAHQLYSQLELAGFTVWRDSEDMRDGQVWKEQLRAALREVDVALVLLTPASVASEYVRWEWEIAIALQKHVIPLLIQSCTVPDDLKRLPYHDLSELNKYNLGFSALIRDLGNIAISRPMQGTQPTTASNSKYTIYTPANSAIGDHATVFNTYLPMFMNPSRREALTNPERGLDALKQQAGSFSEHETQESSTPLSAPSSKNVGIVIALKEEFTELYNQIEKRCTPIPDTETGNYYYLFEHPGVYSNYQYRCVATFVGEMGPGKAGLLTQRLIREWQPRILVMLGIAAALSSDVQLGDVVVASQVDAYLENSKAVQATDSDRYTFALSGEVYRSSIDLINHARNLEFAHRKIFYDWQEYCTSELQQLLPKESVEELITRGLLRNRTQMAIGHIASGPTVGASQTFTDWLKTRDRKYLALEMEAAGFMMAVYEQADPKKTLVLRAISDYGDERKAELDKVGNGAFRRYAIRNAIQLLWRFLDAGI